MKKFILLLFMLSLSSFAAADAESSAILNEARSLYAEHKSEYLAWEASKSSMADFLARYNPERTGTGLTGLELSEERQLMDKIAIGNVGDVANALVILKWRHLNYASWEDYSEGLFRSANRSADGSFQQDLMNLRPLSEWHYWAASYASAAAVKIRPELSNYNHSMAFEAMEKISTLMGREKSLETDDWIHEKLVRLRERPLARDSFVGTESRLDVYQEWIFNVSSKKASEIARNINELEEAISGFPIRTQSQIADRRNVIRAVGQLKLALTVYTSGDDKILKKPVARLKRLLSMQRGLCAKLLE